MNYAFIYLHFHESYLCLQCVKTEKTKVSFTHYFSQENNSGKLFRKFWPLTVNSYPESKGGYSWRTHLFPWPVIMNWVFCSMSHIFWTELINSTCFCYMRPPHKVTWLYWFMGSFWVHSGRLNWSIIDF